MGLLMLGLVCWLPGGHEHATVRNFLLVIPAFRFAFCLCALTWLVGTTKTFWIGISTNSRGYYVVTRTTRLSVASYKVIECKCVILCEIQNNSLFIKKKTGWVVTWYEKYNVNYVHLLGVNPDCTTKSSAAIFQLASYFSVVWIVLMNLFVMDFKYSLITRQEHWEDVMVMYPAFMMIAIVLCVFFPWNGLRFLYRWDLVYCLVFL